MPTNAPILKPTARNMSLYTLCIALNAWASLYFWFGKTQLHCVAVTIAYFLLLVALGIFLFTCRTPFVHRVLASRWFLACWVVLLACLDTEKFHKVPYVRTALATILPARMLVHGQDPYTLHLWGRSPLSPGPGWIILLAPITLWAGNMLLTPLFAGGCAYLLHRRSPVAGGLFLLLVLTGPVFLVQSFAGHDIFVVSMAFAILCLLAEPLMRSSSGIVLLSALAAAFATSRLPMIALVCILGTGMTRLRRQAGVFFLFLSLALTFALHAIFFLWARHDYEYYQPLHLFERANRNSGHLLIAVGAVAACTVFLWAIFRPKTSAAGWMLSGGLFLVAAFIPIAFGEFLATHGNYFQWEGSNYASFAVPLLFAALCLGSQTPAAPSADQQLPQANP